LCQLSAKNDEKPRDHNLLSTGRSLTKVFLATDQRSGATIMCFLNNGKRTSNCD